MLRFFSNVVSSVNISQYEDLIVDINQFEDAAIRDNEKYKNHPSIRGFKVNSKDNQFAF